MREEERATKGLNVIRVSANNTSSQRPNVKQRNGDSNVIDVVFAAVIFLFRVLFYLRCLVVLSMFRWYSNW